jgi:hypothetical protein
MGLEGYRLWVNLIPTCSAPPWRVFDVAGAAGAAAAAGAAL